MVVALWTRYAMLLKGVAVVVEQKNSTMPSLKAVQIQVEMTETGAVVVIQELIRVESVEMIAGVKIDNPKF
ncbi:hypothetical protein BVH65_18255 [Vibrio cholerae]|nr:hypothetical protein [Vibrio cholerae]MBO1371728.1 hypothetical protein [Vibrio cholerae]MBO1375430.1 hypothetical protein [Vibrio cholerae]MBO1379198.1 hypothetical protein [Vibrio cholerae]MBO1408992.1 hypothetical protein [Vibrio cholerae]